jgi:transposase-like protein
MLPDEKELQQNPDTYRAWWKNWWVSKGKSDYEAAVVATDNVTP